MWWWLEWRTNSLQKRIRNLKCLRTKIDFRKLQNTKMSKNYLWGLGFRTSESQQNKLWQKKQHIEKFFAHIVSSLSKNLQIFVFSEGKSFCSFSENCKGDFWRLSNIPLDTLPSIFWKNKGGISSVTPSFPYFKNFPVLRADLRGFFLREGI